MPIAIPKTPDGRTDIASLAMCLKTYSGDAFQELVNNADKDDLQKAFDLLKDGFQKQDAWLLISLALKNWKAIIAAVLMLGAGVGGTTAVTHMASQKDPAPEVKPADPKPPSPISSNAEIIKAINDGTAKTADGLVKLGDGIDKANIALSRNGEDSSAAFVKLAEQIEGLKKPAPPPVVPDPPVVPTPPMPADGNIIDAKIDPGKRSISVTANAKGNVVWVPMPIPDYEYYLNGNSATVIPSKDSGIVFIGYVTADGKVWWFRITSGKGPMPPPDPPVPPPTPVDAFTKSIQDAYASDGSPALRASQLAAIYKLSKATIDDPSLKTIQDVYTRMHKAAGLVMADTALLNTRNAIKKEMDSQMGTTDKKLDDSIRSLFWEQHQKIQKALETCK